MFGFITRQHFFVNLLAALLLVGLLVLGLLWMLGNITNHGEYETVPGVSGKDIKEARRLLQEKGFDVEVQDSVWDEKLQPLLVVKQSPVANQLVKAGRTIYLTINRSQPPLVDLPNLVGLSFRNAELYLKQLGLKLGDTLRRPDIAKDAVLDQLYQGQPVKPGFRLFAGSSLSLVLGSGIGEEEMEVPNLFGQTYLGAKAMLEGMGINFGGVLLDADVQDTATAYVYMQNPEVRVKLYDNQVRANKIRQGQSIDIWLSKQVPVADTTSIVEPPDFP